MATGKASRAAALEAALAEELPFHAAVPRLAAPNADLTSDLLGPRVGLRADEFGIVRPSDPDEVRLADALGLAVLRSANQETPADAEVQVEIVPSAYEGLTKKQLVALAAGRGVVVNPRASNPVITAALIAAAQAEEDSAAADPTAE